MGLGGVRVEEWGVGLGLGSNTDGVSANVLHVALMKVGWGYG